MKAEQKSELTTLPCYNPYFLNGMVINYIRFFDPSTGAEIAKTRWFSHSNYIGSNNNVPRVVLPFEIKRANVSDMTKKTAFYHSTGQRNSAGREIDLYIPINLIPVTTQKEVHQFDTATASHYQDRYSINILCVTEEGYLDETEQYHTRETELQERTVFFSGSYKEVRNAFGKQVDQVTEQIRKINPDFSRYDVEKILSLYELTPRKTPINL
jgi:hypothetical protein